MGPPKERSRDQRWWWQQYLGRGRSAGAGAGAGAVRCELSETGPSASAGACRPEPRPSRKEREGEREGTVTALLRLGDLDSAAWGLTGTLCFGARIADWMIGGGEGKGRGASSKMGFLGGRAMRTLDGLLGAGMLGEHRTCSAREALAPGSLPAWLGSTGYHQPACQPSQPGTAGHALEGRATDNRTGSRERREDR